MEQIQLSSDWSTISGDCVGDIYTSYSCNTALRRSIFTWKRDTTAGCDPQ